MLKSIPITLTNNTEPCQILKMECYSENTEMVSAVKYFCGKARP